MDPKLIREREAFKARALKVPTIEKRKVKDKDDDRSSKKQKMTPKPRPEAKKMDFRTMPGSSQYKFGILAKIVKFMKQRHQAGDTHPLTLEDILDETNQLDVGQNHRRWLQTEALINNPKIHVVEGDKFKFKPKYNIKDRKSLLRLLDKHDREGLGGILYDEIEESLPRAAKILKILGDQIIYMSRPDKKQILFYNDKSYQFSVDEELQKLWRSATVEGVDENKIEEYLERQGITSMQDIGSKKVMPIHKRKKGNKRAGKFKSHNDHMGTILQDYSEAQK